jgi:hypothetical protein
MNRSHHVLAWALSGACLLLAAGCKKEEPAPPPAAAPPAPPAAPTLVSLQLGKAVGADKQVTSPTTTFGTRDTIYASVTTTGSMPNANLTARWTFEDGQVVDSTTQTLNLEGSGTTEFHIAKASRWPTGRYKVEVTLNGAPLGSADFEIR